MDNLDMFEFLSIMGDINTWRPCPIHIHRIMIQVTDQVDEVTVEGIKDKLDPILEELVDLGPGNYHRHSSISKVFKWLADPQRTHHEFNYVVGPMGKYKFDFSGRFKNLYLGLVAAEALAIKSHALEGPWEHAAWFVVWLNSQYRLEYNYGVASDNLSDWIIRVMGDPDICPSPTLRLEFMNMFGRMVCVNAENGAQALNAVMSACSLLHLDDRDFLKFIVDDLTEVNFYSITSILEKFISGGYLLALDQYLWNTLKSQVSNIIRDVSCSYGLNPNRYTGHQELKMVAWFFHITSFFATIELAKFKSVQFYPDQENHIEDVTHALLVLITNFKKSCQMPRLVDITASCVIDVLELVLLVNVTLMNERGQVYPKTLHNTHKLLEELSDENHGGSIVLSPVGQNLNRKYQDELSNLRHELGKYQPESNVICSILYHCNLLE